MFMSICIKNKNFNKNNYGSFFDDKLFRRYSRNFILTIDSSHVDYFISLTSTGSNMAGNAWSLHARVFENYKT
jgi:hypothetical protein